MLHIVLDKDNLQMWMSGKVSRDRQKTKTGEGKMHILEKRKGFKLVRFVLITVLLLSLLIVAVLAEDYTVTTSKLPGDIGVGDAVEMSVSFKNNTTETVNGMLMRVVLPKGFLALVNNTVKVNLNGGAWNQAAPALSNVVKNSLDYKYNYDSSGALLVSLGNIAPGNTVTIGFTVNITSTSTEPFMYNFYRNNNLESRFKGSSIVRIIIMMADVKPVVEKTSQNLNRDGNKANVGDVIEYAIKATNNTTREQSLWTNVTVTDVLPDGVTFMNGSVTIDGDVATLSQFSYNSITRTLRVYLDDLGPMKTSIVTFCASVDANAYGKTISNSVQVSGLDREDNNTEKSDEDDDGEGHTVNREFVVVFYGNAQGVMGTMPPQTVTENTPTPLRKCEFTRTGYVFTGWSLTPTGTVAYSDEANITVTGNVNLYAQWTDDACTINFDKNADTAVGTMTAQTAARNLKTTLKENEFTRPGYTFAGWGTVPGTTVVAYTDRAEFTPTEDTTTLYAVWVNAKYTIRFLKNSPNVNGDMDPQEMEANISNKLNKNQFTLAGYIFAGWSTNPNATDPTYLDEAYITPTGNMDLYAVWRNPTYSITFNPGAPDVQGTMNPNPQVVEGNKVATLNRNQYTRPGYTFTGWTAQNGDFYNDQAAFIPTSDLTLTPVWVLSNCTITFESNAQDATGAMPQQVISAGVNSTLNANGFARANYYFRGWSTSPDGDVVYSDRGYITLTDHITLYAIWGADPCTITFHKNAAAAMGTMTPQVVSPQVPVSLKGNEFENPGYYFNGWTTDPNSTVAEYADKEVVIPVDNMDLYAIWGQLIFIEDHIQYVKGYPDGSVRADNNITRAEAVTIFFRLIDNDDKEVPITGSFADVEGGKWYSQPIAFMARMGIVNGYPNGTFRPDQPITRAEFAKVAARFDSLDFPENNAFVDVPASHWANLYVNSAYEKGWINGYSDGKFEPERNISRAEVMALVNRMTQRKIDDAAFARVVNPYNDITLAHWAYRDVIEASMEHDYLREPNGTEYWTKW